MVYFKGKKYEHFFTNDTVPLQAYTFAGQDFIKEFEYLCGTRYRLLSVVRNGEQEKYGLNQDVLKLKAAFKSKLNKSGWIKGVLINYEDYRKKLKVYFNEVASTNLKIISDEELAKLFLGGYYFGVSIAGVSNMLHMFSSLLGADFLKHLSKYSDDAEEINQNYIYYTQPYKESCFSKILIKKLNKKLKLSARDKNWSMILRVGAYVKGDGSELFAERVVLWKAVLKEIAKRVKLSNPSDVLYLFPKEIKSMIIGRKAPVRLISSRRKLTILFYPKKKVNIYEGREALSFLKDGKLKFSVKDKNKKILNGQPASPGRARGMAVVTVGLDGALASVRNGNILVTVYTSSRYVPAMKKAAAIITETGGITTHAAVISRELGVPCVIAVKDATKIIRTGDMLEVDADKGIIKIIN